MKPTTLGKLWYFRQRMKEMCSEVLSGKDYAERLGGRFWEDCYRCRAQYTKTQSIVCAHCAAACSLDACVKDGAPATLLPSSFMVQSASGGCASGLAASWYSRSPLRLRYPLMRSALLHLWLAALRENPDPVEAWASIMDNPVKRTSYQLARGKGGMVRVRWEQATTLAAAALVHIIRRYGPDRIIGQTSAAGTAPLSFAAGARFLSLMGASLLSSHDWHGGLNPAATQVLGQGASMSLSDHWDKAGCIILWGCNAPHTSTPKAHGLTRAQYEGAQITAITPDYSAAAKLSDHWLPIKAGTDGALALALCHVIIKEYYLEQATAFFVDHATRCTDLPCLVLVEEKNGRFVPGRFVRAADLGQRDPQAAWSTLIFDQEQNCPLCRTDEQKPAPLLTLALHEKSVWKALTFPDFSGFKAQNRQGSVPCLLLNPAPDAATKPLLVTTVFDLLAASLSIARGPHAQEQKDHTLYATPVWQEEFTGIAATDAIRLARDFADNAIATQGRSLILTGAGVNQWYHNDSLSRCILSIPLLCACHGVEGGGWAHISGQSSLPSHSAWMHLGRADDWSAGPRLQSGTSFYYFALDTWRYEVLNMHDFCPEGSSPSLPTHPADCHAVAARLGWLPSYPQFRESPLAVCAEAEESGAKSPREIIQHVVKRLKNRDLPLAMDDPAHPDNVPRALLVWRANPLGAGLKGHEYFLRHMLGTEHAVRAAESSDQPQEFHLAPMEEQGKLDLLLVSDIRCSTTCLYADVVLPAAMDCEMCSLSPTEQSIVPPVTDPPWETHTLWDIFRQLSAQFSRLAAKHLNTCKDVVSSPLRSGTASGSMQPIDHESPVPDWRNSHTEAVPGETLFNLHIVERRYAQLFSMYTSLGPQRSFPFDNERHVYEAVLHMHAHPTPKVPALVPTHDAVQHFYMDHPWMRALGEALPIFRPPLLPLSSFPPQSLASDTDRDPVHHQEAPNTAQLLLHVITPHNKWGINSTLADALPLRRLTRGGTEIWLNHVDAAQAGITDNMCVECFNGNGVLMGRAVLSQRIPQGTTFIPHAQEPHLNTMLSALSGQRGGAVGSLSRPLLKPTQMIGGYAQFIYSFNNYGPTGSQRDTYAMVRKAHAGDHYEN